MGNIMINVMNMINININIVATTAATTTTAANNNNNNDNNNNNGGSGSGSGSGNNNNNNNNNGRSFDNWTNVTELPTFLVNQRRRTTQKTANNVLFGDLETRMQDLIFDFLTPNTKKEEADHEPTVVFPHKRLITDIFQEGLHQFVLSKAGCDQDPGSRGTEEEFCDLVPDLFD